MAKANFIELYNALHGTELVPETTEVTQREEGVAIGVAQDLEQGKYCKALETAQQMKNMSRTIEAIEGLESNKNEDLVRLS